MRKALVLTAVLMASFILAGCAGSPSGAHSAWMDGTYMGIGAGYKGPVNVSVAIAAGKISAIAVVSHTDTPGISDDAFSVLPAEIIKKQSVMVDAVSGATGSSQGLIAAVVQALEKAKK